MAKHTKEGDFIPGKGILLPDGTFAPQEGDILPGGEVVSPIAEPVGIISSEPARDLDAKNQVKLTNFEEQSKTSADIIRESTRVAEEAARVAGTTFTPGAEVVDGRIRGIAPSAG